MQVTIIGAGVMGSLFGAMLQRAGNVVMLVDVRADHVSQLHRRGITIEEPDGGRDTVRVPVTTDANTALAADLFVVFVKTPFTEDALRPLAGRIPTGAPVLTLQNGLGNEETVTRVLGRRVQVVLGVTSHTAAAINETTVRHTANGPTIIGLPDGTRPHALEAIAQMLTQAGIPARTTRHIYSHVWQKLLVNVGINALSALTGLTNGELLTEPEMVASSRRLVAEAVAVMRAEEMPATLRDPFDLVRAVADATRDTRSSMLQDLDAHRRTEIDAINGAIVRRGERHGVDVAANRLVTALVHQRERLAANGKR